ncbi:hypothetical protein [Holdemanella biformis]|uniref:hypothetical protein n=1 Tax=Holdemanella biformis TaxID=1735 RepID=UPI002E75B483|nr:hypothetical protein [Holdemanella biformis]MEE0394601.1 hypothetical protein [Holdemanella biformis]
MNKRVEFLRKPAKYVVVVEYNGKMPSTENQDKIIEAFVDLCADGIVNYPTVAVLNKDDITKIIAKHVVESNNQSEQPKVAITPEAAAAKVIGTTFESKLESGNPAVITLAFNAALVKHMNSNTDVSRALRNAFVVLSRDNVFIKIPLELRERYNITKEVINIIRDLAKIHQLR